MSAPTRANKPFLVPDLDSTDNDDDDFEPERSRKLRRNIKNGGGSGQCVDTKASNGESDGKPQMAKNPLADSDSDLEEILPEKPTRKKSENNPTNARSNIKRPPPPTSRSKKIAGGKAPKRRRKAGESNSDDEDFDPGSEDDDEDEGSEEEESVRSEDLSEENISDSDFMPSDEAEEEVGGGDSNNGNDETIQLSSDGESSPPEKKAAPATKATKVDRENIQTFDPNSAAFWNKVEELKSKGFSIEQTSNQSDKGGKNGAGPVPAAAARPKNPSLGTKFGAFSQLYINFEHEKRCVKKCFMMEGKQKQTLGEIDEASWLSPDFIKACIRVVMCCIRLGDVAAGREAVQMIVRLGQIPGISALTQAMISGAKNHQNNLAEIEVTEREAFEAMKNKEFPKALELLDKVLQQASNCLRLKMARGDCLAHLGRYVDGAKAASSILSVEQKNVGALFLRGFCLYHKDNVDRAITHFQQVLQISKDHVRARTLLQKARQYKDKKEQGARAVQFNNLEEAARIYTDAMEIDPRNKGTNAKILASRAEVYAKMQRYEESIQDCGAALELDNSCLAAMVQRGKCNMELQEWDKAVRDLERVHSRDKHNQQSKKKAGEAALKANNHEEAFRMFQEAVAVDKHNQSYRALLKQAKMELAKTTRKDFYGILGIEPTCGESEIRKAYFKKSKEYHPDKHANANDDEREELLTKFKNIKEAYEVLSDNDKRKLYDSGDVKPPPGGWYVDLDPKILVNLQPRIGGVVRGRGGIFRGGIIANAGGIVRGGIHPRGLPIRGNPIIRGNMRGRVLAGARPLIAGMVRPAGMVNARGAPLNVRGVPFRPGVVPRPGMAPIRATANGATLRGGLQQRPIVRPNVQMRPGMRQQLIRPMMARMPQPVRPQVRPQQVRPAQQPPVRPQTRPKPAAPILDDGDDEVVLDDDSNDEWLPSSSTASGSGQSVAGGSLPSFANTWR